MPFTLSRLTAFVGVGLVLVVLALAGQRLAASGSAAGTGAPEAVAPLEPIAEPPARAALVVHVVGAVRRPGLYRVRDGARVATAISRAGGATRGADLAALNLAAPLVDGIQVLVPPRASRADALAPESSSGRGMSPGLAPGPPVSLSSATIAELDELPGVGPITAQKIVDYRLEHGPFGSVDDLDAVPGIGPTRIEQLRELVTP